MTDSLRTSIGGFDVYTVRNERVEVSVVPALGAKVISLRNRATGREWMWNPPGGIRLFSSRAGDDFARGTMCGWDECLPTIAPCVWQTRDLPDHGEAWSAVWALDEGAWRQGELATSLRLPRSPLAFTREIALDESGLIVRYRLRSLADEAVDFLWAMHPLLPVDAGDRLLLSHEVRSCLSAEPWLETLDFAGRQPACAKVFAGPLTHGRAGIVHADTGDSLVYEWDARENDTLGVWLTRGGWNGYHHLALEVTNGRPDPLDAAARERRCGVLQPGETRAWTVNVLVGRM